MMWNLEHSVFLVVLLWGWNLSFSCADSVWVHVKSKKLYPALENDLFGEWFKVWLEYLFIILSAFMVLMPKSIKSITSVILVFIKIHTLPSLSVLRCCVIVMFCFDVRRGKRIFTKDTDSSDISIWIYFAKSPKNKQCGSRLHYSAVSTIDRTGH